MLEQMQGLPTGVVGIRATKTVTKDDYETVMRPLFDQARSKGDRIRLLYELGPTFEGFTPGAAWDDARLGTRYLRLFERCAVVTDVAWVREAVAVTSVLMPCAVKTFDVARENAAVEWLAAPPASGLPFRLLPDKGVVVLEPMRALDTEDFDAVAAVVDPYIEAHGELRGIVVHARAFPGWENLGAFVRHVRFVRDHQRKVRRVALAADGALPTLAAQLAEQFVEAEVKHFGFDALDQAIAWAAG